MAIRPRQAVADLPAQVARTGGSSELIDSDVRISRCIDEHGIVALFVVFWLTPLVVY